MSIKAVYIGGSAVGPIPVTIEGSVRDFFGLVRYRCVSRSKDSRTYPKGTVFYAGPRWLASYVKAEGYGYRYGPTPGLSGLPELGVEP